MRYLFLLPIILIHSATWSQTKPLDTNRDFGFWSSTQINYKFNKRWTFSLEEQYRLKDNLTAFDRLLTQLEAEYNLSKQFEFGLGLRHLWLNDNLGNQQGLEHHFRFYLDASHKSKVNRFSFRNRLRYQQQNQLGRSRLEGDYTCRYYRWKSTIIYNIRNWKLDPEIATEFFYHSQLGQLSGLLGFKYRLVFETEYRINKSQQINFRMLTEKELQIFNPQRNNVIEIKYNYSFKKKTKGNKK